MAEDPPSSSITAPSKTAFSRGPWPRLAAIEDARAKARRAVNQPASWCRTDLRASTRTASTNAGRAYKKPRSVSGSGFVVMDAYAVLGKETAWPAVSHDGAGGPKGLGPMARRSR